MGYKKVDPEIIEKIRGGLLSESEQETLLVGADLSTIDFSGCNLSCFNLSGTSLFMTNFTDAELYQVNLSEADASAANFTRANLTEANLTKTGLGQANFCEANLFSANLTLATLTLAHFEKADLRSSELIQARLHEANLHEADFTGANLSGADLAGSTVTNCEFRNCDLQDSHLHGIVGFKKATWIGVDIRQVNFAGAYLVRREIADQNYLDEFRKQSPFHEKVYVLWLYTSDCGRSASRWGILVLVLILFYATIYNFVSIDFGGTETWYSPIYHSIVTMTTLGYGDTFPQSVVAQIVVTSQALLGYGMLGGMLAIVSNKLARRAD